MKTFFDFLHDLAANNNRDWFEKNRFIYEEARAEVEAIVQQCIFSIGSLQNLGNCDAKSCMFRIYRDVRFSKNKDPYKINFSALIGSGGKKSKDLLSWYIHFQPGESFLAAGLYEPDKTQLARIRQEIDFNGDKFKEFLEDTEFKKVFKELKGNQLKTIPKGYDKEHPNAGLLRFNQFYIMHPFTDEEVLDPGFGENVKQISQKALPFIHFLQEAIE